MHRRTLAKRACFAAIALGATFPQSAVAVGGQFGMEFAIDAPWRLEPAVNSDGRAAYTAVPITIVFHDTIFEDGRGTIASAVLEKISVGRIAGVRVSEIGTNVPPVTEIPVSAFEEIEVKKDLSIKAGEPIHRICRPSLGQNCGDLLNISDTHEWHGAFWYSPRTQLTPGRNLYLKVTVKTIARTKVRIPTPNNFPAVYKDLDIPKEWTNYLVVHAGEAPLPRFGAEWLYGDFHYHSQMTDNEGESAYSYRNVGRALGAIGFDFVFATDHASNGEQIDGKVNGKVEARDLNASRFAAAKNIIYGPDGANQLIVNEAARIGFSRVKSAGIVPQVYMGEEVDAWPEISAKEFTDGILYFGDFGLYGGGAKYLWLTKQDEFAPCLSGSSHADCKAKYAIPYSAAKQSYLLLDDQGIPVSQEIDNYVPPLGSLLNYGNWIPKSVKPYPSRQHIVYFPVDAGLSSAGWIGSDTGLFGGAGKRLQQVIGEIEANGFAFLAHPVEEPEPGSIQGPDVVPYSDAALTRAWSSPAILGLQFWNENDRYRSQPTALDPTVVAEKKTVSQGIVTSVSYTYRWPFPGYFPEGSAWRWQQAGQLYRGLLYSTFQKLHHGAAAWDRFLRKGLDPQQTAALSWLPKGEPRKWYMAGGSDSHGDWNYRRYGRPDPSSRWHDFPVGDTAIGNPRNLVSMKGGPSPQVGSSVATADDKAPGGPKAYANRNVIDALRAGRFSVTDGPALRIAIDKNRNGKIDDSDFQMGSMVQFFPGEHIPVLVEWFSTREFGPIDQIDLYVGNSKETYAAKGHGSRLLPFYINQAANVTEDYGGYAHDPSGALQIKLADPVGRFSRTDLPEDVRYHGVAKIFLGPAQFKLAGGDQALSYVRAMARTITDQQGQDNALCPDVGSAGSRCGDRFAYSNPIWAKYTIACPAQPAGGPRRPAETAVNLKPTAYIDADNDGMPDICAGSIPDPCPSKHPETGVDFDRPVLEGDRPKPKPGGRGEVGSVKKPPASLGGGKKPSAGGRAETGAIAEPPLATQGALDAAQPAKPVPDKSCQTVGLPT
jgi:hypothetical protein